MPHLACCRMGPRLEWRIELIRREYPDSPIETEAEQDAFDAAMEDRRSAESRARELRRQSLAERRWAAREAREAIKREKAAKAEKGRLKQAAGAPPPEPEPTPTIQLVKLLPTVGKAMKLVRPEQVPMYVASGRYVVA